MSRLRLFFLGIRLPVIGPLLLERAVLRSELALARAEISVLEAQLAATQRMLDWPVVL